MPTTSPIAPELSTLPGAPILLRVRRLMVSVMVVGVISSALMHASRGSCAGAAGASCVSLTLRPSPFVAIALAVIVFVAIGRVLREATTIPRAVAILDRAAIVAAAVAGGSLLIGMVWFFLIPIETVDVGGTLWFPFPFGAVDVATSTTG